MSKHLPHCICPKCYPNGNSIGTVGSALTLDHLRQMQEAFKNPSVNTVNIPIIPRLTARAVTAMPPQTVVDANVLTISRAQYVGMDLANPGETLLALFKQPPPKVTRAFLAMISE